MPTDTTAPRTALTADQISDLVDELQDQLEQADTALTSARELCKRIEYATDFGSGVWYHVGAAARTVADVLPGGGSAVDVAGALDDVGEIRDLIGLAVSRKDTL